MVKRFLKNSNNYLLCQSKCKKFLISHFGFKIVGFGGWFVWGFFWGGGLVLIISEFFLTYAHVLFTCSARNYLCVHVFQPSSREKNYINISQIQIQETKVL